jgi:hypothetical protein
MRFIVASPAHLGADGPVMVKLDTTAMRMP